MENPRKIIPGISLRVLSCKASNFAAILSVLIVTSCSFFDATGEKFASLYQDYSPLQFSEYNYQTNEKVQFKLRGDDKYKFRLSDDEFYVKRTFTLTSPLIERGKSFRESEDRREKERYLTLR